MVSRGMGAENNKARRLCEAFVSCRIGLELQDYHEALETILHSYLDSESCDFLLAQIASPRSIFYDEEDLNLVPDLVVSSEIWEQHVAINIAHSPMESYDSQAAKRFDKLFRHALYLPTPVVVINCPDSSLARLSIASTINDRLKETQARPLVLFRLSLRKNNQYSSQHRTLSRNLISPTNLSDSNNSGSQNIAITTDLDDFSNGMESGLDPTSASVTSNESQSVASRSWRVWDSMRQYLEPDPRIGVCLELSDELETDLEELAKWTGEPIRMVILNCDQFVTTPGCTGSTRLQGRYREFLRTILNANSFMTSFVLQAKPGQDMSAYINHLIQLRSSFELQHPDQLRAWNDVVLNPLQPLSSNLDSNTYRIFELDSIKYSSYQQAMEEALDFLILKNKFANRKYVAMVLGAGRGPLVDAMIAAVKKVAKNHHFKIYALDKNHSSVRSLKYKHRIEWSKAPRNIQVEVVEGDMRAWEPEEKADIIATELLGSFSDNELSPECIDGTYRFSTKETISIPQEYRSYIAPICSYRMHQEMRALHRYEPNAYDQIYVVRLSNYYTISPPQELFRFEHLDLSVSPVEGANQRFKKLTFWSKVDTVCHGFAGFFSSKLFGTTSISTVPSDKTVGMESWFPAFIPIEKPIHIAAETRIEIFFSRKDSSSKVWYEWVIMHPEMTKIHSANGINTAMSKLAE